MAPVRRLVTAGSAAVALAALAVACDLPFAPALDDPTRELLRRKGQLLAVQEQVTEAHPEHTTYEFRLTSTSGLRVRGKLRVPADAGSADRRAAVVMLGGIERGGDAVELLPSGLRPVAAALWYPEELGVEDAAEALLRLDELRDLAWDVPASVLLTGDYLLTRAEVDPLRLAVLGASFGGFFVPAAAAADGRYRNVALLYAGGDLAGLLGEHLRAEVPPAAAVLAGEMGGLRLQRLEPVRYMGRIAPRHVLIVNGLHDDRVTPRSAQALIDATRPPRDVVWLPTGHLNPRDDAMLRELVDTALARLPLLRTP